jgi:hypothetical protein
MLKAILSTLVIDSMLIGIVVASPVFVVRSGTDPTLQQDWQAYAASTILLQDFEAYSLGEHINSFPIGSQTVVMSPTGSESSPYIYGRFLSGTGVQYGNVYGNAPFMTGTGVQFHLDSPVVGFGFWVYDDGNTLADSFTMHVNGVESPVLDNNPGQTYHTVEGFIGVVDSAGISDILLRDLSGDSGSGWEIDNVQSLRTAKLLGDYNDNRAVEAADYVMWRKGGPLQNEGDNPGFVNDGDYIFWRSCFGATSNNSAVVMEGQVPEPTELVFLVIVALGTSCTRFGCFRR